MATYKVGSDVLIQRSSKIPEGMSIGEYLAHAKADDDFNYQGSFMALFRQRKTSLLNLSGSVIFEELAKGTEVSELLEILTMLFDESPEKIAKDLQEMTEALVEKKMIEAVTPQSDSL